MDFEKNANGERPRGCTSPGLPYCTIEMSMMPCNNHLNIAPPMTEELVRNLAKRLYGVDVTKCKKLGGFDDSNWYIKAESTKPIADVPADKFMIKVMIGRDSTQEQIPLRRAQSNMMQHLSRSKLVNVPVPVPSISGRLIEMVTMRFRDVNGEDYESNHLVRLQTFIPGVIYNDEDVKTVQPSLFRQIGETCAILQECLEGFTDASDAWKDFYPVWDLRCAPLQRGAMPLIPDSQRRRFAEEVLQKFEDKVLSRLDTFSSGIVHNDINDENIVLQKVGTDSEDMYDVHGVIDFGDAATTCYIFDLAICIAYFSLDSKNYPPLVAAGHVFNGYKERRRLPDLDLQTLSLCVTTRLIQSLLHHYAQNALSPDSHENFERDVDERVALAKLWWDTPDAELFSLWEHL